jgi:hypothetical protein
MVGHDCDALAGVHATVDCNEPGDAGRDRGGSGGGLRHVIS